MKANPLVITLIVTGLALIGTSIMAAYESGYNKGYNEAQSDADKIVNECTDGKTKLTYPQLVGVCYYVKQIDRMLIKMNHKDKK